MLCVRTSSAVLRCIALPSHNKLDNIQHMVQRRDIAPAAWMDPTETSLAMDLIVGPIMVILDLGMWEILAGQTCHHILFTKYWAMGLATGLWNQI